MTAPARFTSTLEVVQAISSGSSCAILVEGEEQGSDAWMLRHILKNKVGPEVTFYGRDGRSNLLGELPAFVNRLPAGKIAAIVDRDFTEKHIVERTYTLDYAGELFYWQRFCIENYLLEPIWIAEAVETFYMHRPESIPDTLNSPNAIEEFLLLWSRRLAPQSAGNWVIWKLNAEVRKQSILIQVESFNEIFERSNEWVATKLTQTYSAFAEQRPEVFGSEAITTLYSQLLQHLSAKTQTLAGAHEYISGKMLLNALHGRLPSPKPTKDQLRNRLLQLASKNPPEDIRLLVEDRILPRWRRARAASEA